MDVMFRGAAVAATMTALLACSSSAADNDADGSAGDAAAPDGDRDGGVVLGDGGATCPSAVRVDPRASERQACTFKAGAHAATTTAVTDAQRANIPIKHIVVVMKENRSFDHVFGGLKAIQPDADVADGTFVNPDKAGVSVARHHLDLLCLSADLPHGWDAMRSQVDTQPDGTNRMDGFVKSAANGDDGHAAMGYYDQKDLPFYYFLADTFAISDRYFSSFRGPTFPNRNFLLLGTSAGVTATFATYPDPKLPTIFTAMTKAGVSWGVYGEGHALEETLNDPKGYNWETNNPWHPVRDLIKAFADDAVPSVVFVDGSIDVEDEHVPTNMGIGQAWTRRLYDAAVASKAWSSTAILFTYDEAGGLADHVSPSNHACAPSENDTGVGYHELGTRVPFVAISPWARRHYVSHVEHEHTSITRFIETVFDLPALTDRDANSSALLDMFDFDCPPQPLPAAPAAEVAACLTGKGTLTVDQPTFAAGENIVLHFSGGPANPRDWIGVYPRGTVPQPGSSFFGYCGSSAGAPHVIPGAGSASGTVTLGAASVQGAQAWPLAAGSKWTAYYLIDDGYIGAAKIDFDVGP